MAPHNVTPATISSDAQSHEDEHVHAIYNQIASHFSSTRYKPWPIIATFLSTLTTGSIGLDAGTGNGKYLGLPVDRPSGSVWTIGLDRSERLLDIARQGDGTEIREVILSDVLGYGWRTGAFDYAISIATIHHLATPERRRMAVKRLLQCVSPSQGRILIYVWAIEQDPLSKRHIPHEDAPPPPDGKDVFVPWVLTTAETSTEEPKVYNRYYHMFAAGELDKLVLDAASTLGLVVGNKDGSQQHNVNTKGVEIVQSGWERSNHYVELRCWQL